ncbi:MAG: winged helix-turn-helix domain-containing protein [Kofleriaceae bacterium]
MVVGTTAVAQQFYAGRYAEIVAATFDSDSDIAEADLAFVIGALTFVDRVDEAAAVFASWRGDAARTLAASRFFLGLAAARAGYFDRASELLVREGFRARHDPDPWVRAFVFQGLACQCYFTGRYPGAAAHALRALQAAHEAKFPYVAMLGTDMRGHSLVQMGQLQRGIALLEQAGTQARRLSLVNNEFAVETSIATYVTQFDPRLEALDRVEALLRRRAHDSYSRRALLTDAAIQRALRGRGTEAREALEAAARDALRGDTRRGKVTSLLARLWVTRWQHGVAACRELLEQAVELVEPRDVAFRAQLLGFEILTARAAGDATRERDVLDEIRALWRQTHHFAAKAALAQFDAAGRTAAFDEDAVTPVLRAVARRDASAISRIVGLGLVGVIPELLGLAPGRRIILIPAEELVLLEDHGDVVVRERPPRWVPLLLRLLASGEASKERIVAGLWGLRAYHPELHDPPVRTTIHRLRTFLAPYARWIEVTEGGYRTTVPVHLVGGREVALPESLWEEGEVPTLEAPREPARRASSPPSSIRQRLLARIEELDRAAVPDLARSLELSRSTVLRALRELVDEGRIERVGFARATRYTLR